METDFGVAMFPHLHEEVWGFGEETRRIALLGAYRRLGQKVWKSLQHEYEFYCHPREDYVVLSVRKLGR